MTKLPNTPRLGNSRKYNYQYNQGGSGFVSEFWQMLYHKPYIIDRKVYKGNNVQEHTEYEYYEDELSYIMGISVRSNLYCPSSEPDIPIHLNKICYDKEIAGIFSPTVNGNMISGDTDSNPDFTIDNYAIHTGLFRLGRKRHGFTTTRPYLTKFPKNIFIPTISSIIWQGLFPVPAWEILYILVITTRPTDIPDIRKQYATYFLSEIYRRQSLRQNKQNKRKQTIAYLWQESNIRLYSGWLHPNVPGKTYYKTSYNPIFSKKINEPIIRSGNWRQRPVETE